MSIDPNNYYQEIGERLKTLRLECNLGQGEILHFSQQSMSKIENGIFKALDTSLWLFWVDRGYNVNWILTGNGPKKMDNSEFNRIKEKLDNISKTLGLYS